MRGTDILSQAALNKYTFVHNGFAQRRQYMLKSDAAPPDYGDASQGEAAASGTSASSAASIREGLSQGPTGSAQLASALAQ
jgi:phospholipid-binding lipoprotein MlaA